MHASDNRGIICSFRERQRIRTETAPRKTTPPPPRPPSISEWHTRILAWP